METHDIELTQAQKEQIIKFVKGYQTVNERLNSIEKDILKLQRKSKDIVQKLEDHRRGVTEWMAITAKKLNIDQKQFESICENFLLERMQNL